MKRPTLPRSERLRQAGRAAASRLERFRPRTPRGYALAIAGLVATVALLGIGSFAAAFAAVTFYEEYGFQPEANAREWAAHEPAYAGRGVCQTCHAAEYGRQATSQHKSISCESCHGPLAAHSTDEAIAELPLEVPSAGMCARCHAATSGRPVGFPQVDLSTHYRSGECRACHDAHSTAVVRPPVVIHPMVKLPACTVCHKPEGLKELPTGHEEADDAICLGCHADGADGLHGASR